MSYNLVDPTTGDLTRVAGNSNIVDTAIEIDSTWSSKKINDSLEDIKNIPRLTDFDEAIPEKGKNKIYYVNKTIGTYNCAQWCVESMYYDVSGLNQYRGVQKATSLNGVDNIMLMREYYSDSNNVMRWTDWQQLATMDKLGGCSIIKGTTTLITNSSGAMNLSHGGNFNHCTVSIQPTSNKPYFFSYCPLSKNNTYIIVTDWKGEIVTNTEIEFDWVVIGW